MKSGKSRWTDDNDKTNAGLCLWLVGILGAIIFMAVVMPVWVSALFVGLLWLVFVA